MNLSVNKFIKGIYFSKTSNSKENIKFLLIIISFLFLKNKYYYYEKIYFQVK